MESQLDQQQERAALANPAHAVNRAAAAGDGQAAEVKSPTALDLLRNLTRWFSDRYLELRSGS